MLFISSIVGYTPFAVCFCDFSLIFLCVYFVNLFIASVTKDNELIKFNTNFTYSFLFTINQQICGVVF